MIPFVMQSSGIRSKDLIVSRWPDIELFMYYYTNYSTIMHIILAIILIILQILICNLVHFSLQKRPNCQGLNE